MQKIVPFLWYDTQAEEAARFYTSIFKNSKIHGISHYAEGGPMPAGTVMVVSFEINGQKFNAMNAGPVFKFNESVSFLVECDTQEDIDYYWEKLLAGGGKESQCGWLKDKYGLSWQITPTYLMELHLGKDEAKMSRAFQVMLKMVKIDLKAIKDAAEGK
jgi:predicted 3-demethylubiquinone-9 3-methyltransferase (glyoxalase superfamily)